MPSLLLDAIDAFLVLYEGIVHDFQTRFCEFWQHFMVISQSSANMAAKRLDMCESSVQAFEVFLQMNDILNMLYDSMSNVATLFRVRLMWVGIVIGMEKRSNVTRMSKPSNLQL